MSRKRMFEKMIFLGGGANSDTQIKKLHERLNYALMTLGGMQQNGLQGSERDSPEVEREARGELRDAAQDIMTALGFDVKLTRKQWARKRE